MAILINDTAPRNQYTATSGQTVFTVSFEFFENADLKVYKNAILQTITTHYTVTGAGVTGGGSITLTSGATTGDIITIVRDIPVKRVTDFPTSGPFNISALNTELDKIVAMVQEREDDITRVVQLSETDTSTSLTLPVAASRASKVLGFDATGNAIVMQELGNYRGNWAAGTAYVLRDIVKDTSNASIYICVQAHTSSGSQPISTNPNAASWALLIDGASAAAAASSASAAASSASAAASSASAASGSASSASTSASNASTSATNASNSASSASTSATNAANSASSASTSATNAANSATSASGSATTATTQASNASSSASAAAASASTATTQASNASTSASNAASSASAAATSASNAASSASSASTSATSAAAARSAAESARDATLAAYDNFDDRYLGAKTSNPSLDNDGNALVAGALYFNSVAGEMRLWTGSAWVAAYVSGSGFLATSGGTITGDLVISASGATDALRITQTGTGNALVVEDSANPDATPFIIDAGGNILSGATTAAQVPGSVAVPRLQVQGLSGGPSALNAISWATGVNVGSQLVLSRSEGGVIGTHTIVDNADQIGKVGFAGSDGTAFIEAASIVAAVDGTPSTNDMPGRLVFSTTADGASTPTERMRIDSLGRVGFGSLGNFGNAAFSIRTNLAGSGQPTSYGVRSAVTADAAATSSILGFSTTSWAGGAGASPYTTNSVTGYETNTFTLGTNQTVTNLYGFVAGSGLTNATNNYGFYSNIASGAGRWNFYANGTADNFFGGPTTISTNSTSAALRITQTGTGNALVVEDSANPDATPFVVDANGQIISGYTTAVVNAGSATAPSLQIHGLGGGASTAALTSWATGINVGSTFLLSRSEGGTIGTQTIVDSGDQIGRLLFAGSDGTAFIEAASITSAVDGTPGLNDMPGRLVFSTTADGASSPTERMRITNAGNVGIGTSAPGSLLTVNGNLAFNSGYGSAAVAYGCRAWVNFDGTGTVAIMASGNVTSITDNGTGDYSVNFTTAMPDANYSVSGIVTELPGISTGILRINEPLSSKIDVVAVRRDNGVNYDPAVVCVSVFR